MKTDWTLHVARAFCVVAMMFIIMFLLVAIARSESKVTDKEFVAVSSYLILMTVFDVETTFAAIRNSGGREANPIMRPFVKNGRVATYGVQLGIDTLVLWVAHEIRTSKNKDLRKIWWVSPVIVGTAHGVCGGLNCRYVW